MAYRRRQGMGRSSTLKEDIYPPLEEGPTAGTHSTSSSLAAQAIMASAAHRDSSHSSAYAHHSVFKDHSKSEYLNQTRPEMLYSSRVDDQVENSKKMDNPTLRKGLDALTSSMNRIGDTIGNALEEGRTIVENKTADFIQETRKIQIRRKGNNEGHNFVYGPGQQSPNQTSQEDQLKTSRDVAMATAAKAKLLLRELKTVKADLAFAKQRCSQLEEENKILREAREKGVNPADDDMVLNYYISDFLILLILDLLLKHVYIYSFRYGSNWRHFLAEKARLAHENSVYARENRFLREIVEYHQLTMQDVVYLDEGIEEVTEVYPIPAVSRMLSVSPPSPRSPRSSTSLNSLSRSSSSISLRDKPDIPSASTTPRPPPPTQE
ncbi:hypothetical protein DH2020_015192 [Rehmannia glutinosa]|uniref:Uncharacterized protein n=1 Tax=Rehmannia glutinosa TaxID=99300 RepID=A0ABR0WYP0_REHGL